MYGFGNLKLVSPEGFEPSTFSLRGNCSTIELWALILTKRLSVQWQDILTIELWALECAYFTTFLLHFAHMPVESSLPAEVSFKVSSPFSIFPLKSPKIPFKVFAKVIEDDDIA